METLPTLPSFDLEEDTRSELEAKATRLRQGVSMSSDLSVVSHLRETCEELVDLASSNTEAAVLLVPQLVDVLNHEFKRDRSSVEQMVLGGVFTEAKAHAAKAIARLSRVYFSDPDVTVIYEQSDKSISTLIAALANTTISTGNRKVRAECVQALGFLSWTVPEQIVSQLGADSQAVASAASSAIPPIIESYAKRRQNQYVGIEAVEKSIERQMPHLQESERLLACTRLIALLAIHYPDEIPDTESFVDQMTTVTEAGENNLLSQSYVGFAFDAADTKIDDDSSNSRILSENTVRSLLKQLHMTVDVSEGEALKERMAVARVLGEIIAIQEDTKYETEQTDSLQQRFESVDWVRRFFVAKFLGELAAAQSPVTDDEVLVQSLRLELLSAHAPEHQRQASLALGKEIVTQSESQLSRPLREGILKGHTETQANALIALGRVLITELPAPESDLIDMLCRWTLDPDWPWRTMAESLGCLAAVRTDIEDEGEFIADLVSGVHVGGSADRHHAAVRLGIVLAMRRGDEDGHHIVDQLRDQVRETTGEERSRAAELLGLAVATGDVSSDVPQVVRSLREDVYDGPKRRHVAEALGEVGALWAEADDDHTINDVFVEEASRRSGEDRERFIRILGESASVRLDADLENEFVRQVRNFKSRLEQEESGTERVILGRKDTARVLGELVAAQSRSSTLVDSFRSLHDHVCAATDDEYAAKLVGKLAAVMSDVNSPDAIAELASYVRTAGTLDPNRDAAETLGHLILVWDDLTNESDLSAALCEGLYTASSLDERSRIAKTIAELARHDPSVFRRHKRVSTLVERTSTTVNNQTGTDHLRVLGEAVAGQLRPADQSEQVDSLADTIESASDTRTRTQETKILGAVMTLTPNMNVAVPEFLRQIVANPDHSAQSEAARAVGIVVAARASPTVRDTIVGDLVSEMRSAENDFERGRAAHTLGFSLAAWPGLYGLDDIPDAIAERVRSASESEQRIGARALGELVLLDDDIPQPVINEQTGDVVNLQNWLGDLLASGVTDSWHEQSVLSETVKLAAVASSLTTSQFVETLATLNGDTFDLDKPARGSIVQALAAITEGGAGRHENLRQWLEDLVTQRRNPAEESVGLETRFAATAALANLD